MTRVRILSMPWSQGLAGPASPVIHPPVPPFPSFDFYIAPGGGTGTGSMSDPWSMSYASGGAGGQITAGETGAVRGGSYTGPFTFSLNGTSLNPITFRGYPGERPIINSPYVTWTPYEIANTTFNMFGSWQRFWGLEFTGAGVRMAVNMQSQNCKIINCIAHDAIVGFGFWHEGAGGELHGCLSYNNGPNQNGNGYAVYTQNDPGSTKILSDNICFNNWNKTIHAWGGGWPAFQNALTNLKFRGNVTFGSGQIAGTPNYSGEGMILLGSNAAGCEISDHYSYEPEAFSALRTGDAPNADLLMQRCIWTRYVAFGTWTNVVADSNVFYSPGPLTGEDVLSTVPSTGGYTWGNNTHYRSGSATAWRHNGALQTFANWRTASGLGSTDSNPGTTPTGIQVFVRPNAYEVGRANIIIYNWDGASTVSVDLSSVLSPGWPFVIKNAQDFFGADVVTGTYEGGSTVIPMDGISPVAPGFGRAYTPAPMTGPTFQAFVVRLQGR